MTISNGFTIQGQGDGTAIVTRCNVSTTINGTAVGAFFGDKNLGDPCPNATAPNATAPNATAEEPASGEGVPGDDFDPVGDDFDPMQTDAGQRKLQQFDDLQEQFSGIGDAARDAFSQVNETVQGIVSNTMDIVSQVNDTARAIACNVSTSLNGTAVGDSLGAACPNATAEEPATPCCMALTADCLACAAGQSVEAFCAEKPETEGCGEGMGDGAMAPPATPCCLALTPDCLACQAGVSVEDFCLENPETEGCVEGVPVQTDAGRRLLRKLMDALPSESDPEGDSAVADATDAAAEGNATIVNVGSNPPGQMIYDPKDVTVSSGDTVTFVNVDGIPHNVVFDKVPEGADADALSEPQLWRTKGESYSVQLTEPGVYDYYCTPHRALGMVGSITVQ